MDVQLKRSLGIDLGTSSVKVGLYDEELRLIGGKIRSYGVSYIGYGGAEQSPEDWWEAIAGACSGIRSEHESDWDAISSVAVTGQFSGTVPVGSDGAPLRNAIIWLDSRGEEATRKIVSGFPSIAGYRLDKLYSWIRLTGGAPTRSGKDSISHILYLLNEENSTYRDAYKFLEPKDYINLKLTGKFTGTYDSMVLNWITDNRQLSGIKYSRKLLDRAGLDGSKFPELKGSWEPVGTVSPEAAVQLGLHENAVVAGGSGDIQSTLVGSGCSSGFDPVLYVGTSSWVTCHVPFKKTDLRHNIASLPSALPSYYFIAAEQESAGSALSYIRNLLYDNDHLPAFSEIDSLALNAPPGSHGLVFLPWLYGERAPVESRNLRASFFNLSLTHDRSSLVRAVLEGIGYNLKWLLEAVERFAGRKFETIKMAGGGASSAVWPQIIANILQRDISIVSDPVYVNARGASVLAMMAEGEKDVFNREGLKESGRHYRKSPESRFAHERNYRAFLDFYSNNRNHMDRLNGTRQR